jgi:hypothetical protein
MSFKFLHPLRNWIILAGILWNFAVILPMCSCEMVSQAKNRNCGKHTSKKNQFLGHWSAIYWLVEVLIHFSFHHSTLTSLLSSLPLPLDIEFIRKSLITLSVRLLAHKNSRIFQHIFIKFKIVTLRKIFNPKSVCIKIVPTLWLLRVKASLPTCHVLQS